MLLGECHEKRSFLLIAPPYIGTVCSIAFWPGVHERVTACFFQPWPRAMEMERAAKALAVRHSGNEEDKDLSEALRKIAQQLVAEHRNGVKFHKLDGISGLPDAYRVQDSYVAATIGDDARAGYKIGLTSKRMQQMCGIDQ